MMRRNLLMEILIDGQIDTCKESLIKDEQKDRQGGKLT
jgi:hypothetical protein